MRYIADLHIHSPFSRATSKASNLIGLSAWARIKGIQVVGTGDFTHPGWFRQLRDHLSPAEPGFFRLKEENNQSVTNVLSAVNLAPDVFAGKSAECRFVLSAEISSIYKRHGRVRKIHNILYVPDFESAERVNGRLASIGNIESDGRPILGLDSRNLLEILLEQAPEGFLVPAHIWTPWFSLFGSKSGFDSIDECFGDLTDHVFALETGLSSDPDMNRLVSALDRYTLISNSDSHSPAKLGREANLFDTDFHFFAIRDSLKNSDRGFIGTIEFYPEEGKYHYDGHRKCKICLSPEETRKIKGVCPVCRRPLTIGVTHRVMELADRKKPDYRNTPSTFHSLIPLPEVLSEIIGVGPASKGVMAQYSRLITLFGSELNLLLHSPIEEINTRYSSLLGEAIHRIRIGKVIRTPGYDGEFGVIKVFNEGERDRLTGQSTLFDFKKSRKKNPKSSGNFVDFEKKQKADEQTGKFENHGLNKEQIAIVASNDRHLLIIAGPGTGKTHTLIARLVRLLAADRANPASISAITFTNRAAEEVRARLSKEAGPVSEKVFVGTFHGFCLHWLRRYNPDLTVAGREAREIILKNIFSSLPSGEFKTLQKKIDEYFSALTTRQDHFLNTQPAEGEIRRYLAELEHHRSIDIDGVIPVFVGRLTADLEFRSSVFSETGHLFIDEFQDLNFSQYELVRILAEKARVFAIGDPDQAIYGFRGSSPEFFFKFIDDFHPQILALVKNYRSAPAILEAAAEVISRNTLRNRKKLIPQRSRAVQIEYYSAATPQEEAEFIVRRIEEVMGGISHFSIESGRGGEYGDNGGKSFGDFAVLYRISQQALLLSEALERRGIPFQVVDVQPFYMHSPLKAAYYWIRTASGLGDIAEYLALLRHIKGIGKATLRKIEQELMFSTDNFVHVVETVDLPFKVKRNLEELNASFRLFKNKAAEIGLTAALQEVFKGLDIDPGQPVTQRFIDLANTFGKDLAGLSRYLKKNSQATVYDEQAETVSLMTMHAAKGLEFPVVFITGVEEKLLPCDLFSKVGKVETIEENRVQEERRLFYVAITRAMENLILTSSATRTIFREKHKQERSRFLKEIPQNLLKKTSLFRKRRKKPTVVQMKLF